MIESGDYIEQVQSQVDERFELAKAQHPKADGKNVDGQVQILIGTPSLGTIRIEWHNAMCGVVSPPNWALVKSTPTGFSVPDAQNALVDTCLRGGFRALLLIEDDTCPPPETYIVMDRWLWKMERKLAPPIVSGLYHIKGSAEVRSGDDGGIMLLGPEPLIYRGSGQRAYRDWKPGDVVWCSGIPTGALLIHRDVLQVWADEPDVPLYQVPGYPYQMRQIFRNPAKVWTEDDGVHVSSGTSDLWWSAETIKREVIKRAGWPEEFASREYPFIVDTSLHFKHVDRLTGQMW